MATLATAAARADPLMDQAPSFLDVMARLRAGDQGAAREVFDRFARRLVGLARARLSARLQAKTDPEDVVQSVFRSFFVRDARGEWELGGWDGLWGLLTTITVRKCGRRAEYFAAGRRDVAREADGPAGDASGPRWEAVDRDPTPDEAAALTEAVEGLLRGFDGRDRQIVERALQGESPADIATTVGCSTRTAERVLARVRQQLERSRDREWEGAA